jgi:DNA-binding response OmpR family regulator
MVEGKQSLLIVEDDIDVAEMLDAYFRVQGYDVTTVYWGEDAIKSSRHKRPDLVILDIRLPDIDGFEVAKQLREARRTEDVPIIFLTEKRGRSDILQGLGLGADDYITKPFDIQELRLRVRNSLKRSSQGALNNLVTGLPEGSIVDEKLSECIRGDNWIVIVIRIDNLSMFRDTYGFVASDDVLRAISLMIRNAVRDSGNPTDFVGHSGPYEFIVVTEPTSLQALSERIETRLGQSLDYFYPLEDVVDNLIELENQLSLRINIVESNMGPFQSLHQLKEKLAGT